jgi:hypothetical protein
VPCAVFLSAIALAIISCSSENGPDVVAPEEIIDLTVEGEVQIARLRWTAPRDDGHEGRAAQYEIRYGSDLASDWDSASIAPDPPTPSLAGAIDSVTIGAMPHGLWEFGVRSADESGNWSLVSNIVATTVLPDTIAPETIIDFEVQQRASEFHLQWTAPGDDGSVGRCSHYEVRYATSDLVNGWDVAAKLSSPSPSEAGALEGILVTSIGWGPFEFGVKAFDESGNSSGISNVVATTVPTDIIPPTAVSDLEVDLMAGTSTALTWTATGDDAGIGQAARYELRYSQAPMTPGNWGNATPVEGMPVPRPGGEREYAIATDLVDGQTYYFALSVLDEASNPSGLSNEATAFVPHAVQITFSPTSVYEPHWAPDGQSIIYVDKWTVGGVTRDELYTVSVQGGLPRQFSSALYGATSPSWSPDGSRVALSLGTLDDGYDLAVMAGANTVAQVLVDDGVNRVAQPRWSPDGNWIAYTSTTPSIPAVSEIFKVSASGGSPIRLTGGWPVSGLDISPDGQSLVYSWNEGGTYDLWVMPIQGGIASRITIGSGNERDPGWSPDGTKIAYDDGQWIWVIDSDGGNPHQITFGGEGRPYRRLSWSPDGKDIAFGAIQGNVANIWRLRVRP